MLTPVMQAFRAKVAELAPEAERAGDMWAIHNAAWNTYAEHKDTLPPHEIFALGQVHEASSAESALYALDDTDSSTTD